MAATPFALPPTEPHPFPVVAPAGSPGAIFPSAIQPFPLKFPSSSRPRRSSISNKRRRSPACCCSGEACSHARPAPGQLAALCIHETPRKPTKVPPFSPLLQLPIRPRLKNVVKPHYRGCWLVFFGSFHRFWILSSSSDLFGVVSAPFEVVLEAFCLSKLSKWCSFSR